MTALVSAGSVLAAYATLTLAARLAFRRVLFPVPAPRPDDDRVPEDAVAWDLDTEGGRVRALEVAPTSAEASGQRLPIVYFHGNGETAEGVVPLARLLADQGHRVIVAEYPGYGAARSAGPPDEPGLYAAAAAVVDEVRRRCGEGFALWGSSLGTAVAIEMARRTPPRALVLVCPFTSTRALLRHHAPVLVPSLVARDAFDSLAKAPSVHAPALVLHGSRDRLVPVAMGRELATNLPGARFVELSGAGHDVLFTHGDDVVGATLAFLSEA